MTAPNITDWKERHKPDGRLRKTAAARRRQYTRQAIEKDWARLEGTAEPLDIAAVKAALEKWRNNQ